MSAPEVGRVYYTGNAYYPTQARVTSVDETTVRVFVATNHPHCRVRDVPRHVFDACYYESAEAMADAYSKQQRA